MNRYYSFRIITYATPEEFRTLLENTKSYEYIYHDKDTKENGEPKEPHYHINAIFASNKSINNVCQMVKSEQNTLAIPMGDRKTAHEYLTHKNDPEKYQYKEEDIVTTKGKEIYKETKDKENEMEEFLNIICDGSLTEREKAIKCGKDYIRYYEKYEKFRRIITQEEIDIKRGYAQGTLLLRWEDFRADVLTKYIEPELRKIGLTEIEIMQYEQGQFERKNI